MPGSIEQPEVRVRSGLQTREREVGVREDDRGLADKDLGGDDEFGAREHRELLGVQGDRRAVCGEQLVRVLRVLAVLADE